jgi:hypothetical protein
MGLHRPHIPYRNSRMTAVLRDSLGGNCRTVMVATINSEAAQLDESISTCRCESRRPCDSMETQTAGRHGYWCMLPRCTYVIQVGVHNA